tara:strand:- start:52 stop:321 length:270 start_codon:yes stop_codon:yes gene_type:complete
MLDVHIDDALLLFPNFIGYEGDAPSGLEDYENLKPLDGYDRVWNGEKPHWIEVLQKKYELQIKEQNKLETKISAYKKLGLTQEEINAII